MLLGVVPWDNIAAISGGMGVFAWLTLRYMRQVLNSQSSRITDLERDHRLCIQAHQASESYIDVLRGALIGQGLTVPDRPPSYFLHEGKDH